MIKVVIILIILAGLGNLFSTDFKNFTDELKDESISAVEAFQKLYDFCAYQEITKGEFSIFKNEINDTLTAYSQLWISKKYNVSKETPLIVFLHGGISTKDFVLEKELLEYAQNNVLWNKLKEENYIFLFPTGKMGYTWWEKGGMENIRSQIWLLKQRYNIDDNKIYLTGISDGGSGSYHFALNQPDDFACFLPMIGMLGVGSMVNQKPVFISNLQNREIYATNTDKDGLYPAANMRKIVDLMQTAGANILYKEFWDLGHTASYLENEVLYQIGFINSQIRNPFSANIYWETADLDYGKCDWLEITAIDTTKTKKDWHIFHNRTLLSTKLRFGFYNDREWENEGVKVTKIVEESVAEKCGLLVDDIIIGFDEYSIKGIDELVEFRDTKKKNGDKFTLKVQRKGKDIVLKGQFSEAEEFTVVIEGKQSGAVKARYYGNKFVLETSQIESINLYLHPQMVNFENPVIVEVNGIELFNHKVKYDKDFLLENFSHNYDRKALWVNKIELKIDE
ncbi:MAG: PDZ domain-containing protein [Candidatus Cloacimonetes bacterium]|nr:PDZ domain-containing protein [Candidatus Cloacimonadota bacterium]